MKRRVFGVDGVKQEGQVKQAYLFTIKRNIINLCKTYLNLLEELRIDHSLFLKKIKEDSESAEKLDYLGEEKYNYIRKKILDLGNEGIRDIEKFLQLVEMDFKKIEKNQE